MKLTFITLSLILFFFSSVPKALALTAETVVKTSLKHYPKVIEAVLKVDQAGFDLQESEGSFDAKIVSEMDNKAKGFYSGDAYSAQLEKPFPMLNSKIYGGYRESFGTFPSYEGKLETSSDGQAFAGVSLSVLKNSMIDIRRYKVAQLVEKRNQAEIDLDKVKISVQTLALQAYWAWVTKGLELKVHQEVLDLSQKRVDQLNKRIKAGDLAEIYRTENNQTIRRRETKVIKATYEYEKASFYLSLFNRDDQGQPVTPTLEQLPNVDKITLKTLAQGEELIETSLQNNLDLKILGSQFNQAQLEVDMGTNELLPTIDIKFEYGQNRGTGLNRLSEDEAKVLVNFDIPLEFNKGLGRRRSGESQLKQLQAQQTLLRDKVKTDAQALSSQTKALADIFNITKDEINLARTLAEAEMKKFNRGASDLILVNLREEKLAEAQISNLESLFNFQVTQAEIKRLSVQFIPLEN